MSERFVRFWCFASGCTLVSLLHLPACTPEQRAPVRTALEASQCINAIALRHIDAGDDFDDPKTLTVIASEIAVECNPLTKATE
jgi:hypothetical protein